LLKEAVRAFRTTDITITQAMGWLWPAAHAAFDVWCEKAWDELSSRHARLAREVGGLFMRPPALDTQIRFQLFAGRLTSAASLVEQVTAITDVTAAGMAPHGRVA